MPGVEVEFDLEADELIREFRDLEDDWPTHRQAILRALGEDLVGEIQREIQTDTGRAKGTVRVRGEGEDTVVVAGGKNGVDYIGPLLKGSEPHAPGPPSAEANPALARWARRNNYPGGFEAIYWNIYHYGTEPHDFVSDPIDETQSAAGDIATLVLRNRGVFE